jgi:hypothetical protein
MCSALHKVTGMYLAGNAIHRKSDAFYRKHLPPVTDPGRSAADGRRGFQSCPAHAKLKVPDCSDLPNYSKHHFCRSRLKGTLGGNSHAINPLELKEDTYLPIPLVVSSYQSSSSDLISPHRMRVTIITRASHVHKPLINFIGKRTWGTSAVSCSVSILY